MHPYYPCIINNNLLLHERGRLDMRREIANETHGTKLAISILYPIATSVSKITNYCFIRAGCKIAPNTGTNATKFFTLATKSRKLGAKLATRMLHHTLPRDLVIFMLKTCNWLPL